MEEKILRAFDFSLCYVSALTFLERFLRVFGLDYENESAKQIKTLATNYCKLVQRESCFLNFKPSHIAAASLLFSINISLSDIAPTLGIQQLHKLHIGGIVNEPIRTDLFAQKDNNPLHIWDDSIERLTSIK